MAGQPISLTIPSVGDAGTTYASQINTAITTLRTEVERAVTPADMNINANLSFLTAGTNYALTGIHRTSYALKDAAVLTAVGYPMTMFSAGGDGELYWNDNSSRQVQLTNNGALNHAATGGVTSSAGAYGSPAEIRWDSGDGEYEFRTGAGTDDYADLRCDDILMNDGSGNFLRMTCQSMASDYTVTWPAAVPATSNTVLAMSTSGTLTATATPTVTSLTTTAALSAGTNLSVGTLTTTNTLTVSTTSTFTGKASFTLEVAHADRNLMLCAFTGSGPSGGAAIQTDGSVYFSSSQPYLIPIPVQVGWTITNFAWHILTSSTAGTRTMDIGYYNQPAGGASYPGGTFSTTYSTISTRTTRSLVKTIVTDDVTAPGFGIGLLLARYQAITGDYLYGLTVTYKRV